METLGLAELTELAGSPASALFAVLANYPLGWILSIIALTLLCTFFITSANSATFVLGMFTSGGDLNPSNQKKIFWGLVQSALAAVLLLAGGLKPLQTISVAAAFPFIIVMLAACVSLLKALKAEEGEGIEEAAYRVVQFPAEVSTTSLKGQEVLASTE